MVEVRDLQKRFGSLAAVSAVSFTALDGRITALLGQNGAGKTTTLGMICGATKPDAGSINIDGGSPTALVHASELSTWVVFGLVPLATLGAALELLIAATCRTAKAARTWLTMVVSIPMLVGMFLVFFPARIGGWWFVLPIVGQQALIGKSLHGQPVSLLSSAVLAVVTAAAAVPVLASAVRVLERDDMLAG
jgi:energy-coupling factor transporter ATP-binding protein EcfA2